MRGEGCAVAATPHVLRDGDRTLCGGLARAHALRAGSINRCLLHVLDGRTACSAP